MMQGLAVGREGESVGPGHTLRAYTLYGITTKKPYNLGLAHLESVHAARRRMAHQLHATEAPRTWARARARVRVRVRVSR